MIEDVIPGLLEKIKKHTNKTGHIFKNHYQVHFCLQELGIRPLGVSSALFRKPISNLCVTREIHLKNCRLSEK